MKMANSKNYWKMTDAREEFIRSVREGRIESRYFIKSLAGMGSRSHNLGAEIRMHSFTVNCETFANEKKVALAVQVKIVEVTGSEAMFSLSFTTLLVRCMMKNIGRSALG